MKLCRPCSGLNEHLINSVEVVITRLFLVWIGSRNSRNTTEVQKASHLQVDFTFSKERRDAIDLKIFRSVLLY